MERFGLSLSRGVSSKNSEMRKRRGRIARDQCMTRMENKNNRGSVGAKFCQRIGKDYQTYGK